MKKIITAIAMLVAIGLTGTAFAGGIQYKEVNDKDAFELTYWGNSNEDSVARDMLPEVAYNSHNDKDVLDRVTWGNEAAAKNASELGCFVYNPHNDKDAFDRTHGIDVIKFGRC